MKIETNYICGHKVQFGDFESASFECPVCNHIVCSAHLARLVNRGYVSNWKGEPVRRPDAPESHFAITPDDVSKILFSEPKATPKPEPAGDPAMLGLLAWAKKRATAPTPKPFELGQQTIPHQKATHTSEDCVGQGIARYKAAVRQYDEKCARIILANMGYDVSTLKRKAGR